MRSSSFCWPKACLLVALVATSANAQVVLFEENFDNLNLGPAVDESTVFLDFWTPTPPTGWTKDNSQMPMGGVTEWRGWSFADPRIWTDVAGDQRRSEFTRGQNVIAVADPDEWDDLPRDAGRFVSFLDTPSINVGSLSSGNAVLQFDSAWRPECCDDDDMLNNQTATITATFNTGASVEVLRWESDRISPFFKDDSTNELVTVDLPVPSGATTMTLSFGLSNAENDWFWAMDNLTITDGDPTLSALFDRQTGEVSLFNGTPVDVDITGYAIKSVDGALDPVGFTPFANTDPNWVRLSATDETQIIAEGHLNAATIAAGSTLSLGTGWAKYFREESDISFEYLDENNDLVEAIVRFSDDVPQYGIGDFNFDGELDALDWPFVRDNYNSDHSGLTPYAAYTNGDINRDGLTDLRDFLDFKAAYDLHHGDGAFAAMVASIPEPSAQLSLLTLLLLAPCMRRRQVPALQSQRYIRR